MQQQARRDALDGGAPDGPSPLSLVQRERELGLLFDALDRAVAAQTPELITLEAEAGQGKSSLARAFLDAAQLRHPRLRVAYGASTARLSAINGYQPVRDALADLAGRRTNQERFQQGFTGFLSAVRETAPAWLSAIPLVGGALSAGAVVASAALTASSAVEESAPRQFLNIVRDLLRAGPLVLVLDDLHWADASTVELLHTLAIEISAGPLLLVMAFRPADVAHEIGSDKPHPLQERLLAIERYRRVEHVRLSALDSDAVAALWRQRSALPIPAPLRLRLATLAGGNPLFIQEFIGLALDRLTEVSDPAAVRRVLSDLEDHAPRAVEAVISARLMHLSAAERRVLETAAVLGLHFDPRELLELCDLEQSATQEALRALTRRHGLLVSERSAAGAAGYRFEHQILHSVVERELEAEDLFDYQQLHADAAQVAARRPLSLESQASCAHHYWEGGDRAAAVSAAERGAAIALGQDMYSEAAALVSRYLDALAPSERGRLAELAIRALLALGDYWGVVRLWEQLPPRAAGDAGITLAAARGYRMTNAWEKSRATLSLMTAQPHSPDEELGAELLLGEIDLCGPRQDTRAAIRHFEDALSLSRTAEVAYRCEGHIGLALLAEGDAAGAEDQLSRAIATARETHTTLHVYEALHWMCKKSIALLELNRARDLLTELTEISERTGASSAVPFHARDSARVLALDGLLSEAAERYTAYFALVSELDGEERMLRARTDIALQVVELALTSGPFAARRFSDDIASRLAAFATVESRFGEMLGAIANTPKAELLDPVAVIARTTRLTGQAVLDAEAIFRFDIPDFWQRRDATGIARASA